MQQRMCYHPSLVPRPSRFLVHIKYFAYNVCVRAGRSGNEATTIQLAIIMHNFIVADVEMGEGGFTASWCAVVLQS